MQLSTVILNIIVMTLYFTQFLKFLATQEAHMKLNQLQKSSKEITAPLSKNLNMSTGSFLNTSATQRVKITVVVLQRI